MRPLDELGTGLIFDSNVRDQFVCTFGTIMTDFLAHVRSQSKSAPKAQKAAKGRERKGGGVNVIISAIIPVVASHERAINDIRDRFSFTVGMYDETWKTEIVEIRAAWQHMDRARRKQNDENREKAKNEGSLKQKKPIFHTKREVRKRY